MGVMACWCLTGVSFAWDRELKELRCWPSRVGKLDQVAPASPGRPREMIVAPGGGFDAETGQPRWADQAPLVESPPQFLLKVLDPGGSKRLPLLVGNGLGATVCRVAMPTFAGGSIAPLRGDRAQIYRRAREDPRWGRALPWFSWLTGARTMEFPRGRGPCAVNVGLPLLILRLAARKRRQFNIRSLMVLPLAAAIPLMTFLTLAPCGAGPAPWLSSEKAEFIAGTLAGIPIVYYVLWMGGAWCRRWKLVLRSGADGGGDAGGGGGGFGWTGSRWRRLSIIVGRGGNWCYCRGVCGGGVVGWGAGDPSSLPVDEASAGGRKYLMVDQIQIHRWVLPTLWAMMQPAGWVFAGVRRPWVGIRCGLVGVAVMLLLIVGWRFYSGWRWGIELLTEGEPVVVQVLEEESDATIGEPFDVARARVQERCRKVNTGSVSTDRGVWDARIGSRSFAVKPKYTRSRSTRDGCSGTNTASGTLAERSPSPLTWAIELARGGRT